MNIFFVGFKFNDEEAAKVNEAKKIQKWVSTLYALLLASNRFFCFYLLIHLKMAALTVDVFAVEIFLFLLSVPRPSVFKTRTMKQKPKKKLLKR